MTFSFGKYDGWTVEEVYYEDIGYLIWFYNNIQDNFSIKEAIKNEFGGEVPKKHRKVRVQLPLSGAVNKKVFCSDTEDAFRCAYGI